MRSDNIKNFSFAFTPFRYRDKTILRPMLDVVFQYKENRFHSIAMIDSGADYSLLRLDVAKEGLNIPIEKMKAIDGPLGISGKQLKVVKVEIEMGVVREGVLIWKDWIPFHVPIDPEEQPPQILIGRDPFFYHFRIAFRMGFTKDKEIGKFILYPEVKKRPPKEYKKPRPIKIK